MCSLTSPSAISMYEVGVAFLVEQRGLSRHKAVVLIFLYYVGLI